MQVLEDGCASVEDKWARVIIALDDALGAFLRRLSRRGDHAGRFDPEDLLQETYLEAWRQRERLPSGGLGRRFAWLRAIALNKLRNLRRFEDAGRRSRGALITIEDLPASLRDPPAPGVDPGRAAEVAEIRDAVRRALGELQGTERFIVTCVFIEDLPAVEVARILGTSRSALGRRLRRIGGRLRSRLEPFL